MSVLNLRAVRSAGTLQRLSFEAPQGAAYNEEAFRYLLLLERKRAERSGRPLVLLLVGLKRDGLSVKLTPEMGRLLFSVLSVTLREVDFAGWYREDHVVGAVLTQGTDYQPRSHSERIDQRLVRAFAERLPAPVSALLQIRLLHARHRMVSLW